MIDINKPYFYVYSEARGEECFADGGSLLEAMQCYAEFHCDGEPVKLTEHCPLVVVERPFPTSRSFNQSTLTAKDVLELFKTWGFS